MTFQDLFRKDNQHPFSIILINGADSSFFKEEYRCFQKNIGIQKNAPLLSGFTQSSLCFKDTHRPRFHRASSCFQILLEGTLFGSRI